MSETRHYYVETDGVRVRIDELNGWVGFGYKIGDRTYVGDASSVAAARRAIPRHVRATKRRIEKAREANEKRMRDMRTIRSW